MRTHQELLDTIETAQREMASLMQVTQLEDAKRNRVAQIEAAHAVIERSDGEIKNLEQKIEEAARLLDDAIKDRFLSRVPYVGMGVSTAVNNRAQQFITLKDALLRKVEERGKFAVRHADLVRAEESGTPKD